MTPNPILSLRQRADHALFLGNRALGTVPEVIVGEHVRVKDDARWAGLVDVEYTISEVVGEDENAMCKLRAPDGRLHKWFRATDLDPAQPREVSMNTNIEQRAASFEARVAQHFTNTRDWTKAFNLAQIEDRIGAESYRARGVGATAARAQPATVVSLSVHAGETFDDAVTRYSREKGVSLRVAAHEVGKARPDLAAARG